MLVKNLECNSTHTKGAFEIIRSIIIETGNGPIPPIVAETLDELLEWIRKEPSNPHSGEKREGRLRQGIPFHKLIFACRGNDDRRLVDKYRQDLDGYIGSIFEKELSGVDLPIKNLRFPHLSRYMQWRELE